MFKKEYLVSYDWKSKNNGSGTGHFTFEWYGKIKSDDIGIIIEKIQNYLEDEYKDKNDYFNIVIHNIVKL